MKKLILCAVALAAAATVAAQPFTAATYNVRKADDGDTANGNGWERRAPVIASLVQFHDFDIFGAQEVLHNQLQDLLVQLPGYDYTGVGRDDGASKGEYCAVFYKRDRFERLDAGHFWLAEDTSQPNKGWDAKYVRICVWGHFRDKVSNQRFWFFSLHTDHKGVRAQAESCRLVLHKIKQLCGNEPVVLTGDFNVGETSESYAILHDSGIVRDTYELAEIRYAPTGTENQWSPTSTTLRRIDYLFVSPGFRVLRYGILPDTYRTQETVDGQSKVLARTPSDHFPVKVQLDFSK